jgi:hypothetical protein
MDIVAYARILYPLRVLSYDLVMAPVKIANTRRNMLGQPYWLICEFVGTVKLCRFWSRWTYRVMRNFEAAWFQGLLVQVPLTAWMFLLVLLCVV